MQPLEHLVFLYFYRKEPLLSNFEIQRKIQIFVPKIVLNLTRFDTSQYYILKFPNFRILDSIMNHFFKSQNDLAKMELDL